MKQSGLALLLLSFAPVAFGGERLIVSSPTPKAIAGLTGGSIHPLLPARQVRRSKDWLPNRRDLQILDLPKGVDASETARRLVALGLARYAESDRKTHVARTTSDPFFTSSSSWGQLYQDQWGLHAMRFDDAWDKATGNGSIVIAVLDTGVDTNHEDLASVLWRNPGEIPQNGIDDDGNGYIDDLNGYDFASGPGGRDAFPNDPNGHGTLVAGIAAAATDNGRGMAGACFDCRIMALRVLDETGTGSVSDAAAAMVYAVDNGATILNMSLSAAGASPTFESIVKQAAAAGITVVAAAGNSGGDVENETPANIPDVITVAATGPGGGTPAWSNAGVTVDVAGPGVDILGPRALTTDAYRDGTHVVSDDYYRADGTSMSAPLVAGIAALLYAKVPSMEPYRLQNIIRSGAVDIASAGFDGATGYGRADALGALMKRRKLRAHIATPDRRRLFVFQAPLIITGSADGQALASWRLFIGDGLYPSAFTPITPVETAPITSGTLFNGPSQAYSDGLHTLRLEVTATDGTIYEDRRLIEIDNRRGHLSGSASYVVDGSPVTGLTIWAMDPATQAFVLPAGTDATGAFSFPEGLPAGDYVLYAYASGTEYYAEYWKDSASFGTATIVTVPALGSVTGIDFQLSRKPRVTGFVRDTGGVPLPGQLVELLYGSTQNVAATTGTGADGSFTFSHLTEGDYYVHARAGDGSSKEEYWQEVPDIANATLITIARDTVTSGIDFTLAPNTAAISGTVRDLLGRPLSGFPIVVSPQSGKFQRQAVTDAAGAWLVDRLPPGGYTVATGNEPDYEMMYFQNNHSAAGATLVHLFDGTAFTGADFRLGTTWFQEISASSGQLIDPEANSPMAILPFRADADDRPDLYIVNTEGPNGFLVQDGTGRFVDESQTNRSGTSDLKWQAAVFDIENDGDPDLFVPRFGRFGAPAIHLLLRQTPAGFEDATFDAFVIDNRMGTDAVAGDIDQDGYLDLYVVNNFAENALYHNQGGSFTDITATSGAGGAANNDTQTACFMDVDQDGDLDLFVTTSEFPGTPRGNLLFINNGIGGFTEEGILRGVKDPPGTYTAAFGDIDGDGDPDLFTASAYGGILYRNDGAGNFTDVTVAFGLTGVQASGGCSFGDIDNDGRLDLLIADSGNGAWLFRQEAGKFIDRTYLSGFPRSGRYNYLALTDLDLDGRLDVVLSGNSRDLRIYRNRMKLRNWLTVKLEGRRSNRQGIGARIGLTAPGIQATRWIGIGEAGNKPDIAAHFSLGSATTADLTIAWPSGITEQLAGISANQILHLVEPVGESVVAAPGPGVANPAEVRLFAGNGAPLASRHFIAYAGVGFGARLAGGELATNWPSQELVTLPGDGPTLAPHLRGFAEDGTPLPGLSLFAFGSLRYGGNPGTASGIDPLSDIILAGPGGGTGLAPHIRGFHATGSAVTGLSFFAFPGVQYGARPASLDTDGDARDEIVATPGPGPAYGAQVRTFFYRQGQVTKVPGGSFFAFNPGYAGARAAGRQGSLVVGPGPSPTMPAEARGFTYQAARFIPLPGYVITVFPGHAYGLTVGFADLDGTGYPEALAGAGPDPTHQAHVRAIAYSGTAASLRNQPNFFAFDSSYRYGVMVAAVRLVP